MELNSMSSSQPRSYGRELQGTYVNEIWLKQIASALTKGTAVKIRQGKKWSANPSTKVLTYAEDIKLLNPNQALGLLLHEVGHLKHTKRPETKDLVHQRFHDLSKQGFNMLEDKRIEALMKTSFPGANEAIEIMNKEISSEVRLSQADTDLKYEQVLAEANVSLTEQAPGAPKFKDAEELERVACGLSPTDVNGSPRQIIAESVTRSSGIPTIVRQVLLEGALQHLGHAPIANHPVPCVPELGAKVAEMMKEGKVEDLGSSQEVQDFWEQKVAPDLVDWFNEGQESRNRRGKGEPQQGSYDYNEKMKEKCEDMHDKDPGKQGNKIKDGWSYGLLRQMLLPLVKSWAPRFKKVLKDNEFRKMEGRYDSGRLNPRRLYKIRTGDYKLFQRPYESSNKDYSFMLLCDVSGSMYGEPLKEARKAIVLVHEILAFCGIKTLVSTFDNEVYEAKGIKDNKVDVDKFHQALGSLGGGGTDMELGLVSTIPSLLETGSLNKVHITITDGGVSSSTAETLRALTLRYPGVDFYGIGIGKWLESLDGIYPRGNCLKVNDMTDLAPALIKIMKRKILTQ